MNVAMGVVLFVGFVAIEGYRWHVLVHHSQVRRGAAAAYCSALECAPAGCSGSGWHACVPLQTATIEGGTCGSWNHQGRCKPQHDEHHNLRLLLRYCCTYLPIIWTGI